MKQVLFGTLLVLSLTGCLTGHSRSPVRQAIEFALSDSLAANPTSAISGQSAYVAHTSRRDGQVDVYLQRTLSDTLHTPVRVNHIRGDAATHAQAPAQVATAPDGSVYVAWIKQTPVEGRAFPASDIRLARSGDGGHTFEPAITVNPVERFPTSHGFHDLAVGPDGTLYVSWLDGTAKDSAKLAMRGLGSESHGGHHAHHEPENDDLPGTELRVARSRNGGRSFEPPVTVARGTCQCCRTAISVGSDGAVYVVWRHIFGDQIRDMAIARSNDGGRSFTTPTRVHADDWQINGCPHAGPDVAVDAGGRVHVIWFTGSPGRSGVLYAASRDRGRTFGKPAVLAPNTASARVGAVMAGHGLLLTWEDPMKDSVYVRQVTGTKLGPVERMQGRSPAVASYEGTWALAWHTGSGTRLRMLR